MWTDDGWTTEASHPISSAAAFGSGEVNIDNSQDNRAHFGGWGCKHCSSFVRLALSMSEINENVFNIEIIPFLRQSYPAFKLFFIVSNHFFFTQSNY